jgi:hypothetical protein
LRSKEPSRRTAVKLLTKDDAQRITANVGEAAGELVAMG